MDLEKPETAADQAEHVNAALVEDDPGVVTVKTWIVVLILSVGYGLSFWPIPLFAAIQSQVASEMGTPTKYIWWIPSWSLAITVSFLIFGPNTDLLGRRWFLVLGNLICFVGQIVIGVAKNANTITAGMTIVGFGAANCQMAAFAVGELLPNKWRHIGVVLADLATIIAVVIAPVTARFGFQNGNWHWNFYAGAILQFLSFLGLLLLYFPPKHPNGIPHKQVLKEIDYLGIFLFIAGAAPFLAAIIYCTFLPSDDVHVTANFGVGAAFLIIFALWENLGQKAGWIKRPLTPTRVFTAGYGRDLTAPCIAIFTVNAYYYSTSIIYPTMINVFWSDGGEDWRYACLLSVVQGLAIGTGVAFLTFFGSKIKRWNWQMTAYFFIMVLFGVLLALGKQDRKGMVVAFIFLSQSGYSAAIYLNIAVCQLGVEQKDLGLSGGISGTSRFAGGAVATAVYTAILQTRLAKETANLIPAAAISAGLPASEITSLMAQLNSPTLSENFSSAVVAAVSAANIKSYERALSVVALSSLAFGVVGLIACLCCRDIGPKMDNKIEVFMENTEQRERNKFH